MGFKLEDLSSGGVEGARTLRNLFLGGPVLSTSNHVDRRLKRYLGRTAGHTASVKGSTETKLCNALNQADERLRAVAPIM